MANPVPVVDFCDTFTGIPALRHADLSATLLARARRAVSSIAYSSERPHMVQQTISRRKFFWIAPAALAISVTSASAISPTSIGRPGVRVQTGAGRQLSLRDQLLYGLSVATKQDREFVDRVVALVHVGVLPRNLVDSTFLWARQNAALRGGTAAVRPMIYFRPALEMRARRLGIHM